MPTPKDLTLYNEAKAKIMKSYKKNSAFASGAVVKEYKRLGGEYINDDKPKHLTRWFKEKWVDVNPILGITNHAAYPVFRPTHKVSGKTPTLLQEIPEERLKEQYHLKQKYRGTKNLPDFIVHHATKGGKLSVDSLKGLLTASYDDKQDKVDNFEKDKSISSKTSKVYIDPNTGQVVVAHKGTSGLSDWLNNAVYAVGGKKLYKYTPRYKESERVQKEAEAKYGKERVSTIGHSQGGLQAELLGDNSNEIITLNKATRPFSNTKHENQYDIRTENDLVSSLNPFTPKSHHDIIIPSTTKSYLTEHGIDTLGRLDKNRMVGGMIVRSFGERPENK